VITDSTKRRRHIRQFPLKKLESLVRIAVDNNLSLLQVGDVRIIPGGKTNASPHVKILEAAEKKAGRPLTEQEKRDEILFGPGGSLRLDDV
jgi:hypothetical protein